MGAMSKSAKAERKALQRAVVAEVLRVGPEHIDRPSIVAPFVKRGTSKTTVYRWLLETLSSPMPAQAIEVEVRKAARERKRKPKPAPIPVETDPETIAEGLAQDVLETMPLVPRADEAIVPGGGIAAMAEKLSSCIQIAEQVADFARTPEGAVRNSKLLLQASEHLRRSLDTAIRLQSAIVEMSNVQRFNREIFLAVKDLQPEAAATMLVRLRQVNASWSYLDSGQT